MSDNSIKDDEIKFYFSQIQDLLHDLQHSFMTVSSYLTTLMDMIPRNIKERSACRRILDEIYSSSSLSRLYLKKLRRIGQNNYRQIERNNLRSLIEDVVSIFSMRLSRHRIRVSLQIPDNISLNCDSNSFEQIFLNLFSNSITSIGSAKRAGLIKVVARIVDKGNNTFIQIMFSDDGNGIPKEIVPLIFDRGFSSFNGTGLGLSIAKRIIEEHGGSIDLERTLFETGAQFIIEVPDFLDQLRGDL